MGLDDPDHDVDAFGPLGARGLEHGEGLSHAGGGAEEDFELPALLPRLLFAEAPEQGVGIGTSVSHVMARSG